MSGAPAVHRYHDGTKHHFTRFARSLGYLDWASQPDPFRSYRGASSISLRSLSEQSSIINHQSSIASILRHSLGLSAWKQFRDSRWSLRVNPSSGNLHPTEAYVVSAGDGGRVWHYAPDRHALEQRCAFDASGTGLADEPDTFLLALTSIGWREAWKYGERAFRYCQHDLGHAIAAVRIAASLHGLQARILADWSHADIAALTGIDRDEDFIDAEREEPGGVIVVSRQSEVVSPASRESSVVDRARLLEAVRAGVWTGRASQLSEEHVQWTFIDEIAEATRSPGHVALPGPPISSAGPAYPAPLLLQRRSAVALDGMSSIPAERFFAMLQRAMPSSGSPWDVLWWDARIHLALFVHRVDGVEP
ncbi:MAG TPA: SagB/ThcOx family dehydrogenase, partial [Vicinamibacterales bacterium]|nr:SagB/ThcOx family dehydrogenase [Vicinamibacterales bacterium]